MNPQYFADASKARVQITKAQQRAIAKMYTELSEDIAKEIASISNRTNVSSILRTQYLQGLSNQINQELSNMGKAQTTMIKDGMLGISKEVIVNNDKFLQGIGLKVQGAYSHVPADVVKEIASGKLYEDRWSLSEAIWGTTRKTQSDVNRIVAQGVAGQKSTYEIAKDLEDYVNPAKRKDWAWAKVYPGTARVVDYNAQRLARTMISHAYQDSLVRATVANPFVECYEWMTSNSDRVCQICQERESGFHGVVINGRSMYGCYYAEDLPLDHPNGMCTVDVYIEENLDAIADRLADWVNGNDDTELDTFAESMGYTSSTLKSKVQL